MGERKVRAVVSGKVQGVWFRAWTVEAALARGLRGWVRNRADGTVEAVLAGEEGAVEAMLAALRDGPPLARVAHLEVEDWPEPVDPGFKQRPTA